MSIEPKKKGFIKSVVNYKSKKKLIVYCQLTSFDHEF